ncbi:RNA 2',3'-cyclic phosphodiesterase [Patescibacteria group bacterium]
MERTFIGVKLHDDVIESIKYIDNKLIEGFKDANFVRPETCEMTLAFVGNLSDSDINKIISKMDNLNSLNNFYLNMFGPVYFPDNSKRMLVLKAPTTKSMSGLISKIDSLLKDAINYNDIKNKFIPHITLARLKKNISTIKDTKTIKIKVDNINLFSSQLTPRGAVHKIIHQIKY